MDNFRCIYKILKTLEKAMDYEEFDYSVLSAEQLRISEPRFEKLLIQMQKAGYIEGLNVYCFASDKGNPKIRFPIKPAITIAGLEYLKENKMMKKMAEVAKGVIEIIH